MLNYSLFLFLFTPIYGLVFLRYFIGLNNVVYLIPFSIVMAVSIFLDLIHVLNPMLGIQNGINISLILMFLSSIIIFIFKNKNKFEKIDNPFKRSDWIFLMVISFFILFLSSMISDKWVMLDFKFHLSQVNYFLRTNKFPVGMPESPTILVPYHYGFDIFCASISKIFNIPAIPVLKCVVIVFSLITFLSGFAISYFVVTEFEKKSILKGNTFNHSLLGALFFYFTGNLLWFDALLRYFFHIPPVENSWSLFKTVCAIGLHGGIVNDLSNACVFFASLSLGLGLFFLLAILFFNLIYKERFCYKTFIGMFIVSVSLFQCAESVLYAFLLSVSIAPFIFYLTKLGTDFKKLLLRCFLSFMILPVIIIINSIFNTVESSKYIYLPTFLELTLNPHLPFIEAFGRFGDINEHSLVNLFSWNFFAEMGPQFIFFTFIIIWLIKTKTKISIFFISFFFVSFTTPFLLYIKSSPPDSLRLLHPGIELLNLFFAFFILDKLSKIGNLQIRKVFSFVLPLMILPPLLKLILAGIFSLNIYLNFLFINKIDFLLGDFLKSGDFKKLSSEVNYFVSTVKKSSIADIVDIQLANFLNDNYRTGDCGFSFQPTAFNLAGIPCYLPRAGAVSREFTFSVLSRTLDPYLIEELKIRWIFLDPKLDKVINKNELESLKKSGFLKETFSARSVLYEKPLRLYEFVNLDRYKQLNPRKTYWSYFRYMTSSIIPVHNEKGQQQIYLFKTEKEADLYLKEMVKVYSGVKDLKPFINAVDEEMLKKQVLENNITLKYF